MGWFSTNRRPFSRRFLERLDRIEAAVTALLGEEPPGPPAIEVIPVQVTGSKTESGEELFSWKEITRAAGNDGGRSSDGYDAAGVADPYAFAAKPAGGGESFVVKHWVADIDGGNPIHEIRHTLLSGDTSFWAEITGSSPVASLAKWTYEWAEVEMASGEFVAKTGGRGSAGVGVARNTLEDGNTGALAYGIAVTSGGPAGDWNIHDTDNQFKFKPVPSGAVVRMRIETHNDVSYPVFAAPNPIDGIAECPEEPPP